MSLVEAYFCGGFGQFQLDVDFSAPAQGVTALFGPSGCGKTSVLRCMAGLTHMADGRLRINGQVWQDHKTFLPPHKRPIGYVFQEASLFPHMSVRKNLTYGLKRSKKEASSIDFDEIVTLLGLTHLLDRAPLRLSGGERQRVAIGRALMSGPELLLMDEPLAALDRMSKNEILPYLDRLSAYLAVPIFYVSHDIAEVERLADSMILMEKGRLIATGPLSEVLTRLDLPFRQDEEAAVVLTAQIVERDLQWHLARAAFPGGSLWVRDPGHPLGQTIRLRILARDVSLAASHSEGVSILNLLSAKVVELAPGSHQAVVLARLAIGETACLARLTAKSVAALQLTPGKEIWAQIKSVAILD